MTPRHHDDWKERLLSITLALGAALFALYIIFHIVALYTDSAVCTATYTTTEPKVRFVEGWPRIAVEPLLICTDYTLEP